VAGALAVARSPVAVGVLAICGRYVRATNGGCDRRGTGTFSRRENLSVLLALRGGGGGLVLVERRAMPDSKAVFLRGGERSVGEREG
jgi:hypothetical protein